MRRNGYTLMEVMTTATIIAILAAVALPNYLKSVRRARGLACRDILLTIFAGEQTYQASNGVYLQILQANRLNDTLWRAIFMDNPNRNGPGASGYRFYVPSASNPPLAFTAVAEDPTFVAFPTLISITETGQLTCGLNAPGTDPGTGCYP